MPPKFTSKRVVPGDAQHGSIQFQCKVNRRENAHLVPILNANGNEQCVQCKAHTGAVFQGAHAGGAARCSRGTCLNSLYCWQHLRIICKLRIGTSRFLSTLNPPVNGLGLYAWSPTDHQNGQPVFSTGDVITSGLPPNVTGNLYGGERLGPTYPPGAVLAVGHGQGSVELDTRYDYSYTHGGVANIDMNPTAPYADIFPTAPPFHGAVAPYETWDAACVRGPAAYANDTRAVLPNMENATLNNVNQLVFNADVNHGEEIFVSYGDDYWDGMVYTPGFQSGSTHGPPQYPSSDFNTSPQRVSGWGPITVFGGAGVYPVVPAYNFRGVQHSRGTVVPGVLPYPTAPLFLQGAQTTHMP